MFEKNYFTKLLFVIFVVIFAVMLLAKPEICEIGVANAIIICGRVLIPSLFPFSVCVLYIIKCGILDKTEFLSPVTKKIFGLQSTPFIIMILSMLGGYPIGAKLINEAVKNKTVSVKQGRVMLNYCVNAGPAFIVSAVGNGLLQNKKLGFILLFSHILSSFILCIFSPSILEANKNVKKSISSSDNFVSSAGESAEAVISICGFVILFSVLISYIEHFSKSLAFLKPLLYIAEVTTAISKTNNIYLISFLLGFSGICIWCQILSVSKQIKLNIFSFSICRILHGILSAVITFIMLKIFPIEQPTFSNTSFVASKAFFSTKALGISLLILGVVFIISLSNKNKETKILEEFI